MEGALTSLGDLRSETSDHAISFGGVALGINDLQNRICFKRMGIILFKKNGNNNLILFVLKLFYAQA